MLVPVLWMKDYLDIDKSDREIADKVTYTGSHVESINKYKYNLDNIVVGQIKDISTSEDLKNLLICKVDIRDEVVTVLTGAKNFKENDKVILAKIGAKMPNGLEIKKQSFDGHESSGMLCSYEELGFPDSIVPKNSRNGIAILSSEVEIGKPIEEALDLDNGIIELEITPNRGDCLSITGMAREIGAAFFEKIEMPENEVEDMEDDIYDYLDSVAIQSENCSTFIARVIKDVEIKDSPQWIQNRLMQAGIRPINNLVDLGNFVMLEYGQPLHVYDLDKIKGRKVIVRDAEEGEKIVTLDGNERKLSKDTLLIADENDGMCIAGIMGGFDTEVTKDTKNVMLEAAVFNKNNIRETSRELNLVSESSLRNEKGANPIFADEASKRFAYLCEKENIGKLVNGSIKVGQTIVDEKSIDLRIPRVNLLAGRDFSEEEVVNYLESLELEVSKKDNELLSVKIPFFRRDLNVEVDLIEEVIRMYGMHNIEAKPLKLDTFVGKKSPIREFKDKITESLYAMGLSEILTYSFISPKHFDLINLKDDNKLKDPVRIINPLGEDFSVMRTTLIPEMMTVLKKNINNRQNNLRLYEVANVFEKIEDEMPKEKINAIVALYGDYDFYYIKDIIENLFKKLNVEGCEFIKNRNNEIFHTERCASIMVDGNEVGVIGEIHPLVSENYDIDDEVYICELYVNELFKYHNEGERYVPIIKFPPVERDISIVIDREIESKDIEKVIRDSSNELLHDIELFDIYTGKQISNDKKSYAYKLRFISPDRTLKDEEVNENFKNIVEALKKEFNVDLRI